MPTQSERAAALRGYIPPHLTPADQVDRIVRELSSVSHALDQASDHVLDACPDDPEASADALEALVTIRRCQIAIGSQIAAVRELAS
jgi:flavoprotein